MKIYQSDYKEIMNYMVDQRWQGYEFVACPFWNGPVSKEELFMFDNRLDAIEFCDEHSTDSDRFSYLPIRSVYRSMSEALQDDSIMVEKDGLVDLLSMVNKYHEKLEQRITKDNETVNETGKTMDIKNIEFLKKKLDEKFGSKSMQLPPLDKNSDEVKLTFVSPIISNLDPEINKAFSKVIIIVKPKSKEVKDKHTAQLKRKR